MIMEPKKIDDATMAFPAEVMHLLPPYDAETKELYSVRNKWESFISHWFYKSIPEEITDKLKPAEGIDKKEALRHLKACMGSYQPKHEHKIGGCARLLKDWFGDSVPEELPE